MMNAIVVIVVVAVAAVVGEIGSPKKTNMKAKKKLK